MVDAGVTSNPTVTIANAASLSGGVDLAGLRLCGIVMPAAFTGTTLTFQSSHDGTNYQNLYDNEGTEVSFTVAASRNIALTSAMLAVFSGRNWLKVRSGTSGTPTTEAAARTITLVTRPI